MRPWGISILLSLASWAVIIGWVWAALATKGLTGYITLAIVLVLATAWVIRGFMVQSEDDDIDWPAPTPPKDWD